MEDIRQTWLNLEESSSSLLAFFAAMSGEAYEIIGLSFEGTSDHLEKIGKICEHFKVVIPIYTYREDIEEDFFQSGSLRALKTSVDDFGSVDFLNFSNLDFLSEFQGELGDVFLSLEEKTDFILEGEFAHKDPKSMNNILKSGEVFLLEKEAIPTSQLSAGEIYENLSPKTKEVFKELELDASFEEDIQSNFLKLLQSYIYRKSIIYQKKIGEFSEDPKKNGLFQEDGEEAFYLGVQGNEDFYSDFLRKYL